MRILDSFVNFCSFYYCASLFLEVLSFETELLLRELCSYFLEILVPNHELSLSGFIVFLFLRDFFI